MKRSTERILTTHTGSLPRPADLLEMMQTREGEQPVDPEVIAARVRAAVADVVRKQVETGIDVVNDGEFGKPGFNVYVIDRLEGLGGANTEPRIRAEAQDFPEWNRQTAGGGGARPFCMAPLAYRGAEAVGTDIRNLRDALANTPAHEAFVTCASPGTIHYTIANRHYPSPEAYLFALADAMKEEYHAVARAGLLVQIDAPDHAMDRSISFRTHTLEEFRSIQRIRVEALNHALEGIPEEQIRYHICWATTKVPTRTTCRCATSSTFCSPCAPAHTSWNPRTPAMRTSGRSGRRQSFLPARSSSPA